MLCLTSILLALQLPVFAQNSSTASALADRQDAEERYKRMSADVEALQAANASLQKKINALEDRLSKMSEDLTKANSNSSVHDDLKVLRDKIQDVDKKRESDKQVISEEIKKSIADIEKMFLKAGSARPTPVKEKPVAVEAPTTSDNGFTHKIEDGETLLAILQAYNKKFKSDGLKPIKLKQIEDANPGVDWNRLKIGQKIVIPAPAS